MPTVYDQQIDTYGDAAAQIRVISNIIQMISPKDTPTLDALGGLDAARSKFEVRQNGKKVELLEDELMPVETTANHSTTIATNDTQFTVADASLLQDGSVILIDSEYMVVKTANNSTNQISVYNRAYGGTNATHASTSAISIVGMARLEGDDADYVGVTALANPFNYTSIFEAALNVSGTEQAIDHYAIDDTFAYQAQKKVPELLRLVNRMIFHGIRAAGATGSPRSAGGLGTFITGNSVAAGGAITKAKIDDLAELIELDGGAPDLLIVHPSVARDMKDVIDTSSFVQVGQDVDQLGTAAMRRVSTQYGTLRLVVDRWCPLSKAYMITSSKAGLYTLRPFGWKKLGLTGDGQKGEVVGEFSLLVANDGAHGVLTGITS